jgi:uncharacterized protein
VTSRYTVPEVDFVLQRDSTFSYQCNACSRCCHHKVIRVRPFEILWLARRLGMTTTQFIAEHTEAGGSVLRTREDDDSACIFLGAKGCGVHSDRPIVCRIYPLGMRVDADGRESYGRLIPHPETEGEYGVNGTVSEFLDQQGLTPAYAMAARYRAVFVRMINCLKSLDPAEIEQHRDRQHVVEETDAGLAASPWIDIDKTVAEFCETTGRPIPAPADIEGAVATHIEAIDAWIGSLGS